MAKIIETGVSRVALATGPAAGDAAPVTSSNPLPVTTAGGSSPSNIAVEGNVASGAADTGNPVKIGGRYNTTLPTLTNGQRGDAQLTARGSLQITLMNSTGDTPLFTSNTPAVDGWSAGSLSPVIATGAFGMVFNAAGSWDRQRGDVYGTDMVMAARPTAGGITQFRRLATADTNLVAVKASAGRVYGYVISNTSAAAKFVKLYNKATAPTLASDVPVRTIMVPAGGIAAYHVGAGLAGFTAGIAIAATGAIGDTDTTALAANDLIIQIDYA